jgi:hypothetical protein
LKSIPEGTEVRVYTQKIRASGDVWQAVRAPDQDIPFGWIVTSEDRVRPVESDEETTTEFYSLYMNVAWEGPERTEELVPWMRPYYQHVFDQKITLSPLQAMARLAEDTPFKLGQEHAAETLPENYVVIPRNEFTTMNGEEWQKVVVPYLEGGLTTGWLLAEKDVLDAFSSAEVDVGRIETDGDENIGLRYRSWTDFTRENIVGIANKGEKAYLSEAITSQKSGWPRFKRESSTERGRTMGGGWLRKRPGRSPMWPSPRTSRRRRRSLKRGAA